MRVALTFDDGPSEWTGPILDLLADHGARASFFVCGHAIAGREDLLWRMVREGHDVGVHTFDHPRLTTLDDNYVDAQLKVTAAIVRRAVWPGRPPRWWRAPYFDHDDRVDELARALGLTHVGCDVNTGDWAEPAADRIAAAVGQAVDGDIVDLHDGIPPDGGAGTATRQPTVDALETVLQRTGVEWVTVTELWQPVAA